LVFGLLVFALATIAGAACISNHYQALHFAEKEKYSQEMSEFQKLNSEKTR